MKKAGKVLSLIVAIGVAFSAIVTVTASAQEINSADDMYIDFDPNIGNPSAGSSFAVVLRDVDTDAAISGPVSWRTSNSSVASVSGSTATATVSVSKNNSTFELTATSNGFTVGSGTWHTRQVASQITSVTVNQSSVSLSGKGSTAQITVRMTRSGDGYLPGSVPDVTSSNSGVAVGERVHSSWNQSFLGGYVTITATGSGSATITIKSSDGPSASCRVTVSGCGGSTTVTNNPRPSATGGPGGTTAKSPVGEAGTSTNPGGTAAAGNAGSSNAPVPSGSTAADNASSAAAQGADSAYPKVSLSNSNGSESAGSVTSKKASGAASASPLVPIIICVCIGVLLGVTAIVLRKVHKARTRKVEDMSSMDETAELDIPSDWEKPSDSENKDNGRK